MPRSVDLQTAFSTSGSDAVAAAVEAARAFAPTCPDPATCGSEWTAGVDLGAAGIAVRCVSCGRCAVLDPETSAELRQAAGLTQ